MPPRLMTWLAYWPLLASAQAGLSDAPGPTAVGGCNAFVVGPCMPRVGRQPPSALIAPGAAASAARGRMQAAPGLDAAADDARTAAGGEQSVARHQGAPANADIDRYIADHGKPPREVARALLDPTDQNIAAMMRRLQRDQALAAYIGQRMTELAQSDPSLLMANGATMDLPAFTGLRLVLVTRPDCGACDRAAQALQQLVATYPTLDARVAVAGARDARHIVQEMARAGVTLPTAAATDELLARVGRNPPYLLVADARQQREALMSASLDSAQLRRALLAFRDDSPSTSTRPPRE